MAVLSLLLYKDLIVRLRHWKTAIFLQCLVPIALFVLIQAVRDFSVQPPRIINESTYYPIETKKELIEINTEFTFLYYVPQNEITQNIMENVRICLQLPSESKYYIIFNSMKFYIILLYQYLHAVSVFHVSQGFTELHLKMI